MKIVLATSSPYRIALMKTTKIPFEAKTSNVDEYFKDRPTNPEELVNHLSKLKAESIAKDSPNSLVLGFDSVGWFNGQILEKPKSYEEAFKRLKLLSGKKHQFYTGITLINTISGTIQQKVVLTKVLLRNLSEEEIKNYLENDPSYKTIALGFDPYKGISSSFMESIDGDPMNYLQGFPLASIIKMIKETQNNKGEDK